MGNTEKLEALKNLLNDNNDNLIIISRTITPEIDLQMEVKKINIPEIGNFFIWYY